MSIHTRLSRWGPGRAPILASRARELGPMTLPILSQSHLTPQRGRLPFMGNVLRLLRGEWCGISCCPMTVELLSDSWCALCSYSLESLERFQPAFMWTLNQAVGDSTSTLAMFPNLSINHTIGPGDTGHSRPTGTGHHVFVLPAGDLQAGPESAGSAPSLSQLLVTLCLAVIYILELKKYYKWVKKAQK